MFLTHLLLFAILLAVMPALAQVPQPHAGVGFPIAIGMVAAVCIVVAKSDVLAAHSHVR